MGAVEVASSVLVVSGVVNVAAVDDSPTSVVDDDSDVPLGVVWSSVVVGFAFDVSLGVALVACEVLVVVSGALDEVVKAEDVETEIVFALVVEVGVLEGSTVVVASGVVDVSVVVDKVASGVTVVGVSVVEVDVIV